MPLLTDKADLFRLLSMAISAQMLRESGRKNSPSPGFAEEVVILGLGNTETGCLSQVTGSSALSGWPRLERIRQRH
jgi:hypothetical protein